MLSMTRNIDELNNLRSEPPEIYFGKMKLSKEQTEKRIEYTEKANEIFDVILIWLLTLRDNGTTIDYYSIRNMLESWLMSLVNEYATPDDYLIDYVSEAAFNFIEITKKNIEDEWYLSADRSLYNAENSANDVFNYKEYTDAIQAGKTEKQWIIEPDNRVRKTHRAVDKKPIPIKDYFQVGLAKMRFPKDYEMAEIFPEELVNCRCKVKYLPEDKKG